MAVFLCHLSLGASSVFLKPFDYGYLGVSYFFVLSGFVLTWSLKPEASVGNFYLRRFARVYPAHVAALALAVVLIAAGPRDWPGIPELVSNILLIQAWSPNPDTVFAFNGPSWSLSCEMAFYAAFPAAVIAATRMRLRTMWFIVAVALVTYITATTFMSITGTATDASVALYVNPLVRLPQFLVGIAVARSVMSGWRAPLWVPFVALIGSLVGIGLAPHHPAPDAWMTLAAAGSIAFFAQLDMKNTSPRWLTSRPLQYAGRISFCFYLVHYMLIDLSSLITDNRWIVAAASLIVSSAAAAALHHAVENPCNRWVLGKAQLPARSSAHGPVERGNS